MSGITPGPSETDEEYRDVQRGGVWAHLGDQMLEGFAGDSPLASPRKPVLEEAGREYCFVGEYCCRVPVVRLDRVDGGDDLQKDTQIKR